jgi:hypothetical protein
MEAVISCDLQWTSPVTWVLRQVADPKLVRSQTEAAASYFFFGNHGVDVYSGRMGKARFLKPVRSSDAGVDFCFTRGWNIVSHGSMRGTRTGESR